MLLILTASVIVGYFLINIAAVALRNYRAQKFFQTKSPQLPVLAKPNILTGHALSVLASGRSWKVIEDLHEKYGPTFGYYVCNQAWVSTKDIELIKQIEIDAGHKNIDRPFIDVPFHDFSHSIIQVNGDQWRNLRHILSSALRNQNVKSAHVSSDIGSVLRDLAGSMERRIGRSGTGAFVMDAKDLFSRFSLAVIFLITYKQSDIIDFDCEHEIWIHQMDLAARTVAHPLVYLSMIFPFLRPLCQFLLHFHSTGRFLQTIRRYIEKATDINRVARQQYEMRQTESQTGSKVVNFGKVKSHGQFRRRLVDTVIDAYLENKISSGNFFGTLMTLLLAAGITTADTISSLMWELAKNPDCQQKLRNTILEAGIDADYVVWCIKEAIRKHPAIALSTGRVLANDITVNGLSLAKGTYVMPTIHGIHHDPNIWPEPERFNPDRWRDGASFHPAAFQGFGLGIRNCVGDKLAMHIIKLVLEMVLSSYHIGICDQTPEKLLFSTPGLINSLNDVPVVLKFESLAAKNRV